MNIYNKDGTLLLAKDQELTEEIIIKLRKFGAIKEINADAVHNEIEIFEYVRNLKDKFDKFDEDLLNYSSIILTDILFTKSNSWYFCIKALSNYVDWVYAHTINVALISLIIAFKLDYTKEMLNTLCLGCVLHDVGKLLIPKNILQKPGKLSDQEMILIKQHCELGCSMIKDLDLPSDCTDIILQHHERLDGSGYPYGLHSNKISDNAKIAMIADVLDAITSYRPYQNSRTINVAMEELKKDESKYSRNIIETLEKFFIM
jgi:putative nucleotidyltransferase with HDIG domain